MTARGLLLLMALLLTACGGEAELASPADVDVTEEPTEEIVDDEPTATEPDEPMTETTGPETMAPEPGGDVELLGDGVGTTDGFIAFGDSFDDASARLRAALGEPDTDTGPIETFSVYGTCPGSELRVLEYDGGAFLFYFGDDSEFASGELHLYAWQVGSDEQGNESPRKATVLVGDVTTFSFGLGTTVAELRDGLIPDQLEVYDEEPFGPGFTVEAQNLPIQGSLTSTDDSGAVTWMHAGTQCGE